MNWEKYWVATVSGCVLLALTLNAQAYELQRCQWLSNQAYSQAWQRDAGVAAVQLKLLIRASDEQFDVKQGLTALSRYVYAHPEKSPDDLAVDILTTCKGYDQ